MGHAMPGKGKLVAWVAAACWFAAATIPALAADCIPRASVRYGETASSIAQRCGINVERLKAANPGINEDTARTGIFVEIPRPALPSSKIEIRGNRGIVPPSGGAELPPSIGVIPNPAQ